MKLRIKHNPKTTKSKSRFLFYFLFANTKRGGQHAIHEGNEHEEGQKEKSRTLVPDREGERKKNKFGANFC